MKWQLRKNIRRWWMLVTAPPELVRISGSYYVLHADDVAKHVVAYPVVFTGIKGWKQVSNLPNRYFTNMTIARKKSILAEYYIEVME